MVGSRKLQDKSTPSSLFCVRSREILTKMYFTWNFCAINPLGFITFRHPIFRPKTTKLWTPYRSRVGVRIFKRERIWWGQVTSFSTPGEFLSYNTSFKYQQLSRRSNHCYQFYIEDESDHSLLWKAFPKVKYINVNSRNGQENLHQTLLKSMKTWNLTIILQYLN